MATSISLVAPERSAERPPTPLQPRREWSESRVLGPGGFARRASRALHCARLDVVELERALWPGFYSYSRTKCSDDNVLTLIGHTHVSWNREERRAFVCTGDVTEYADGELVQTYLGLADPRGGTKLFQRGTSLHPASRRRAPDFMAGNTGGVVSFKASEALHRRLEALAERHGETCPRP